MKDNTVTIHPTVRLSTILAIELIAEERNLSIGKVIEQMLEKNREFSEKKKIYYDYKKS